MFVLGSLPFLPLTPRRLPHDCKFVYHDCQLIPTEASTNEQSISNHSLRHYERSFLSFPSQGVRESLGKISVWSQLCNFEKII